MSDSELKEVAPFPWRSYKYHPRPYLYRLVDAQDLTVLLVPGKAGTGTGERAEEIAEYVLRVTNSHEDLLEAAKTLVGWYGHHSGGPMIEALRGAIAKAERR